MLRPFTLVTSLVLAGMLAVAPASADSTPASQCAAAKRKAITKYASRMMNCWTKATSAGDVVNTDCTAKASATFALGFAKAEGRSGCLNTGDAALIQEEIDEVFVAIAVARTPIAPKHVFLATGSHIGQSIGGTPGADAQCNYQAASSGLTGTYQAWISSGTDAPRYRLPYTLATPFVLADGTKIADNWHDLMDGTLDHPIDRTASGAGPLDNYVWTGTSDTGESLGLTNTCSDWTSGVYSGARGRSSLSGPGWSNNSNESCAAGRFLYCFEE